MSTMGALVISAALALGLAHRLRLPAPVLGILAGVLLSSLPIPLDGELIRSALLLAATFLVFSVGAEVDRSEQARFRRGAVPILALHFVATMAVAGGVAPLLDIDRVTFGYLALALAGSSTLLVRDLLRRRERVYEPIGRLASVVGAAQDLVVVVALSLLAAAVEDGAAGLLQATIASVALATASGLVMRFLAPRVLTRPGLGEEERLLFVLAILFAFTAGAVVSDLPLVAGAYFAGLALSRSPVSGEARGQLIPFADFFRALFFVLLGAVARLPDPVELAAEAALIAAVLLVRPVLLVPLVRATGLGVRSTIEAVTLLAQSGELALVVALVGVDRGQIEERVLGVIVTVALITLSITPWLSSDRVVWRLTRAYPGRRRGAPIDAHGRVLLIGCGETGRAVIGRLGRDGVVIVDHDPAVVAELEVEGFTALRGNGSELASLRAAGLLRARAVISTMRYASDNARLLGFARGRPVFVRVFSEAGARVIRELGGHPVVEAEVALEGFLAYLDREPPGAPGDASLTN